MKALLVVALTRLVVAKRESAEGFEGLSMRPDGTDVVRISTHEDEFQQVFPPVSNESGEAGEQIQSDILLSSFGEQIEQRVHRTLGNRSRVVGQIQTVMLDENTESDELQKTDGLEVNRSRVVGQIQTVAPESDELEKTDGLEVILQAIEAKSNGLGNHKVVEATNGLPQIKQQLHRSRVKSPPMPPLQDPNLLPPPPPPPPPSGVKSPPIPPSREKSPPIPSLQDPDLNAPPPPPPPPLPPADEIDSDELEKTKAAESDTLDNEAGNGTTTTTATTTAADAEVESADLPYPLNPVRKYYKPKRDSYIGNWINAGGVLINCNASHCFLDNKWKPINVIKGGGGVIMSDTGWEGKKVSDVGTRWKKILPGRTVSEWWDRLPDPEGFLKFAQTARHWIDLHGFQFKIIEDRTTHGQHWICYLNISELLTGNSTFDDCNPLSIKDGIVKFTRSGEGWKEEWVLVDYFEHRNNGEETSYGVVEKNQTFASVNGRQREMHWRCLNGADAFRGGDKVAVEVQGFHPTVWDIGGENNPNLWMDGYGTVFQCSEYQQCKMVTAPDLNYFDPEERPRVYFPRIQKTGKRSEDAAGYLNGPMRSVKPQQSQRTKKTQRNEVFKSVLKEMKGHAKPIIMQTFKKGRKGKDKKSKRWVEPNLLTNLKESIDYDGHHLIHWYFWNVDQKSSEVLQKIGDPRYSGYATWHKLPNNPEAIKLVILQNVWFTSMGNLLLPSGDSLQGEDGEFYDVKLRCTQKGECTPGSAAALKIGAYVVVSFHTRTKNTTKGELTYLEVTLYKTLKPKPYFDEDLYKKGYLKAGLHLATRWQLYQAERFVEESESRTHEDLNDPEVIKRKKAQHQEEVKALQKKVNVYKRLAPPVAPFPVSDDDELVQEAIEEDVEEEEGGGRVHTIMTCLFGMLFALSFSGICIYFMGSTKTKKKRTSMSKSQSTSRKSLSNLSGPAEQDVSKEDLK